MALKYQKQFFDEKYGDLFGGKDALADAAGGSYEISREIRQSVSDFEHAVLKLEVGYQTIAAEFDVEYGKLATDELDQVPYAGDSFLRRIQQELFDFDMSDAARMSAIKARTLCQDEGIAQIVDELVSRRAPIKEKLESLYVKYKAGKEDFDDRQTAKEKAKLLTREQKWARVDEKHSQVKEGFVYVMNHSFLDGLVKIGFSARNPDARAKELSKQSAFPGEYTVCSYIRTKDPYIVEQRVHTVLTAKSAGNECFKISEVDALELIKKEAANLGLLLDQL